MSEQLGHVGVATNGKRNGSEPSEHPDQITVASLERSTEERLDRLMETIQSWDWRAHDVDTGQPELSETAAPVSALSASAADVRAHPLDLPPPVSVAPPVGVSPTVVVPADRVEAPPAVDVAPPPVEVRPDPVPVPETSATPIDLPVVLPDPPVDVAPQPVDVAPQPVDLAPPPVEVRPDPVPVPEASATRIDTPAVLPDPPNAPLVQLAQLPPPAPVTAFGPEEPDAQLASEPLPWPEPETEPAAKAGPLRRLWSHRWTKAAVLCLVSVAAVLLIIWSIRLAHNPGDSSGTPTTVAHSATSHGDAATSHTSFVSPVTPEQLARYKLYASPYLQANVTASKAIASAGSTPTTAQLAAAVAAYHYAVNLYDFQLRFIQWPASMQASIADDHAQLEALVSFLASFTTVSSTNMSGWLSGLHIRTTAAETTDNLVRRDLGLPSSNSYPS